MAPPSLAESDLAWRRARDWSCAFALLGAVIGGSALTFAIGAAGSMLAIGDGVRFIAAINAVAHAVVFGWLGLACLATAWRVLPPRWGTPAPRGCATITRLLAGGCLLHALGQLLAPSGRGWLWLALAGSGLEVAALAGVADQFKELLRQRRRRRLAPTDQLVALAVPATFIAALFDAWHTQRIGVADLGALIPAVQLSQPPLRNLELHGMACAWLLALGWATEPDGATLPIGRARSGTALIALGTLAEVALWFAYRRTLNHAYAAAVVGGAALVGIGVALVVRWRGAPRAADRGAWRWAWPWLGVSLVMTLLLRPYAVWRGVAFSHAWFAALGQAAAVGCIAQALLALDARALARALPGPLILALNLGCALHVVAMVGTDWDRRWGWLLVAAGALEGGAILVWIAATRGAAGPAQPASAPAASDGISPAR